MIARAASFYPEYAEKCVEKILFIWICEELLC